MMTWCHANDMNMSWQNVISTRDSHSLSRDLFSVSLLMNTFTHVPNMYVWNHHSMKVIKWKILKFSEMSCFVLGKGGGGIWTLYLEQILHIRMNLPGKTSQFVYLRMKIMKKYLTVSFIIYFVTGKLSRHPILTDNTRFCK